MKKVVCFYDSGWNKKNYLTSIGIVKVDLSNNKILSTLEITCTNENNYTYNLNFKDNQNLSNLFLKNIPFLKLYGELCKYVKNLKVYCLGDKDLPILKLTLSKNNKTYNKEDFYLKDIQDKLNQTIYDTKKLRTQFVGLSDFKQLCNLDKNVSHNSLEDAIDLMNCYTYLMNSNPNEQYLNSLTEKLKENNGIKKIGEYEHIKHLEIIFDNPNSVVMKKLKQIIPNELLRENKKSFRPNADYLLFLDKNIKEKYSDISCQLIIDGYSLDLKDTSFYLQIKGKWIDKTYEVYRKDSEYIKLLSELINYIDDYNNKNDTNIHYDLKEKTIFT